MSTETVPATAVNKLDEILERAKAAGEAVTKIAGIESRMVSIEASLEKQRQHAEEVARRLREQSLSLPGLEDKKYRDAFSYARVALALKTGNWKGAEFEKEVGDQTFKHASSDVQTRIMSTLTGAAGGYTVPMEIAAGIVEKFTPRVIAKRLGAITVGPAGAPYQVVKETGFPTAYMVGEASAGTASDGAFGVTNLTPKQAMAIVTLTKQQAALSTPSTEQFITRRIAERLAAKQDQQIFHGAGSSNEVTGLLPGLAANPWGIQTQAAVTTTELNLGDINKAMSKLDTVDVPVDKIGIAIYPAAKWEMYRTLFKQFTSQTEGGAAAGGAGYIFQYPFVSDAKFTEITGLDIASSSQLSITLAAGANEVWPIVGKFDEYMIAEWGGFMLESSDVATVGTNNAFSQNLLHLKASMWFDGAPIRPDAFCAITGVVASF